MSLNFICCLEVYVREGTVSVVSSFHNFIIFLCFELLAYVFIYLFLHNLRIRLGFTH